MASFRNIRSLESEGILPEEAGNPLRNLMRWEKEDERDNEKDERLEKEFHFLSR